MIIQRTLLSEDQLSVLRVLHVQPRLAQPPATRRSRNMANKKAIFSLAFNAYTPLFEDS